jgi:TetR/AcrR family transcriptional repressor of mexJK operon
MYDLLGRLPVPLQTLRDDTGEIESVLLGLAGDLIGNALKPEHLAIHRVVTFETRRNPEFARWIDMARRKPLIRAIARILDRHRDELRVVEFEAAAEQFSSLTFDSCLRVASLGTKLSPRDIDERIRAAVDLFLAGARRRDPQVTKRVVTCQAL